jgi:hypothetical protein
MKKAAAFVPLPPYSAKSIRAKVNYFLAWEPWNVRSVTPSAALLLVPLTAEVVWANV